MFWYIPLESLDARYTRQMKHWIITSLGHSNIEYRIIEGTPLSSTVPEGKFLNFASRAYFSSSQIGNVARLFYESKVSPGDMFFVADFWHPGIEALAYIADLESIPIKIYGINHAGPFDPTDLTSRFISWGKYQEATWYELFTKVFVGSEFIRTLILNGLAKYNLPDYSNKIIATGQVWDEASVISLMSKIEKIPGKFVIWPHRIAPEKNLDDFYYLADTLAPEFPDVTWLITSSIENHNFAPRSKNVTFLCIPKIEYYAYLSSSALMVSTSYQETYGYTIREATAMRVPILCPVRAVYPEMILSVENLYYSFDELVEKTREALSVNTIPIAKLKPMGGFDQMLKEMELT